MGIQNDLERDIGVLNTEKKSLHDKVTQLSGLANEADIASYKSRIDEIHEEVKKKKETIDSIINKLKNDQVKKKGTTAKAKKMQHLKNIWRIYHGGNRGKDQEEHFSAIKRSSSSMSAQDADEMGDKKNEK